MKKFIILSIILLTMQSAYAQIVTNSGLERLERRVFNETYKNDNIDARLERLERKMFGAEQQGTLDQRYITLRSAAQNYKAYNPDYYQYRNPNLCSQYAPPLFTYGQGSNWRRTMWNNFRNYAGLSTGMPTGITPAMDPAYMDWFEADRASKDAYYGTNHGYGHMRTNTGSGLGVNILD